MFKKLFSNRAMREKWETGLVWFRLRYLEPEGPTRCLKLLSRPQACGRVALYYLPGKSVSRLYLGIPETHLRLLRRMAADFGFSLKPKPPEVGIPAAQRLTAVTDLPGDRAFMAHIVNEAVFVNGEKSKSGSYWPQASLLGERLAYVNIDGASLAGGFNPLAAVPGCAGSVGSRA